MRNTPARETLKIEEGWNSMKREILVFGMILALCALPVVAQEAEEEEKEPAWVGSLGLSWVATSGNTDTSSAGLDFGLDRKPEPWGFEFVARGNKAQDTGVTTAENYFAAATRDAQTQRTVGRIRRPAVGQRPICRL